MANLRKFAFVKVVKGTDSSFPKKFKGKTGFIKGLNYDTCGASRKDPFYLVCFPGQKTEYFWREELEEVTK